MEGRLERQLKRENNIKQRLKGTPAYVQEFYSSLVSSDKESTTSKEYINTVLRFLSFIRDLKKLKSINDIDPADISLHDIEAYLADMRYVTRKGKTKRASGSYRAVIWSTLHKFYQMLVAHGYVTENLVAKIERPKNKDPLHQVSLTKDEIAIVMENVKHGVGSSRAKEHQGYWRSRDKLIITMFLLTGMRISALAEINVDDFNEDYTKVKVITKGGVTHYHNINDTLRELLFEWLQRRKFLLKGYDDVDALFISNRRQRMSVNTISALVTKYTTGIDKHITPHKFRSTYATEILKATNDIYFVQQCMGHANISTTERYIADSGDSRKEAGEIMAEYITI